MGYYHKYLRTTLASTGREVERIDITREPWGRHFYLIRAKEQRYPKPQYKVDIIEDDQQGQAETGELGRGRTPTK